MYPDTMMKNLPETEKPYEKCSRYGAEVLSDAELIAVLLRTGTKGTSSVTLAREILNYEKGGILNLYRMNRQELMEIPGIGNVKAVQLKCMAELSKRLAKTDRQNRIKLTDAASVAGYYMEQLRHQEQEIMVCMMLDNQNHLLGDTVLSKGTVNATLITPREVYLEALRYHAVNLILIHNHPGGNPAPSKCDKEITERICQAGEMLGINLLDHIIIGDHRYISFREEGLMGAYPE